MNARQLAFLCSLAIAAGCAADTNIVGTYTPSCIAFEGNTIELPFKQPVTLDHVIVMEDIAHGERVRAYEIEGLVEGGQWKKLCDGVSIGRKRIQQFEGTEVAGVRFRATEAVAIPKIRRLAVFNVG